MSEDEKKFSVVDEASEKLNIMQRVLSHKLLVYNVGTKKLPGSNAEYIVTRDVKLIEQGIK